MQDIEFPTNGKWQIPNSLSQHSNQPTRGTNILDLVLTTNPSLINDIQVKEGISDHDIVIIYLDLKRKP